MKIGEDQGLFIASFTRWFVTSLCGWIMKMQTTMDVSVWVIIAFMCYSFSSICLVESKRPLQQEEILLNSEAQQIGSQFSPPDILTASEVEYVDGPLAPLYDFLLQRRLNKFCKLLRDANLDDTLTSLGSYFTLFVPSDTSFYHLSNGILENLKRNPQQLREFLLHHFINGDLPSTQITNELLIDSVEGSPLRFNKYGGIETVSGAHILESDLQFELGRVYIIDRPLYPRPTEDILSYLRKSNRKMYNLISDTGLTDYLSSGSFTILAPKDDAFNSLSTEFKDALSANKSLAERVLMGHVLPGSLFLVGISDGMQMATIDGSEITFSSKRGSIFANGIPIAEENDFPFTNGVIHIINQLILPERIETDCNCKPSISSQRPSFQAPDQTRRQQVAPSIQTTQRPSQQMFTRQNVRPSAVPTPSSLGGNFNRRPSGGLNARPQPPMLPTQPTRRPFNQPFSSANINTNSDIESNVVSGPRSSSQSPNIQNSRPPLTNRWNNRQNQAPRYPPRGSQQVPNSRNSLNTHSLNEITQPSFSISPGAAINTPLEPNIRSPTQKPSVTSWQNQGQMNPGHSLRTQSKPDRLPGTFSTTSTAILDQTFESNRQKLKCRRREEAIIPSTQNLPICPELEGNDQSNCRPFYERPKAGDRRPLCRNGGQTSQQRTTVQPRLSPSVNLRYPNNQQSVQQIPQTNLQLPGQIPTVNQQRPGQQRPSFNPQSTVSQTLSFTQQPTIQPTITINQQPSGQQRPTTNQLATRHQRPVNNQQQPGQQGPAINQQPTGQQRPIINQQPPIQQRPAINQPPTGQQRPTINQQPPIQQRPAINQQLPGQQRPTISQQPPIQQRPAINQQPPIQQRPAINQQLPGPQRPDINQQPMPGVSTPQHRQPPVTRGQNQVRGRIQLPQRHQSQRPPWQSTTKLPQIPAQPGITLSELSLGNIVPSSGGVTSSHTSSFQSNWQSNTFKTQTSTIPFQIPTGSDQPQIENPNSISIPLQHENKVQPSPQRGAQPGFPQQSGFRPSNPPRAASRPYPTRPQSISAVNTVTQPSTRVPNSQGPYPTRSPIISNQAPQSQINVPNLRGGSQNSQTLPQQNPNLRRQPGIPQRPGITLPNVPRSTTSISMTGSDMRRTLFEIVEDPALLIQGQPVKLTKVLSLFDKAGMQDILTGEGPYTVFLPSDDAFSALPKGVLDQLEENPDLLRQVLQYHVTTAEILPSAEVDSFSVQSLEGTPLVITMLKGGRMILISGAKAIAVTRASNGIFYVINQFLYPIPSQDISGVIASRPDLSILSWMLNVGGLGDFFQGEKPYTLLAPTDNAFSKLADSAYEELSRNTSALREILLNHIIEGAHYGREFFTGPSFVSARGGKLKFQVVSYGYQVNEINIKTPEIVTGTGIIHLIDDIILEEPDVKYFKLVEESEQNNEASLINQQNSATSRFGPNAQTFDIQRIPSARIQFTGLQPTSEQLINSNAFAFGPPNENQQSLNNRPQTQRGTNLQLQSVNGINNNAPQNGDPNVRIQPGAPQRLPNGGISGQSPWALNLQPQNSGVSGQSGVTGNSRQQNSGQDTLAPTTLNPNLSNGVSGNNRLNLNIRTQNNGGSTQIESSGRVGQPSGRQGPQANVVSNQRLPQRGISNHNQWAANRRPQNNGVSSQIGNFRQQNSGGHTQTQNGLSLTSGKDVADIARSMGMTKFASWITNNGLLDKVNDGGQYTVFAPSDDAVNTLPEEMLKHLTNNPDQTRSILEYHILPTMIKLDEIKNEEVYPTLLPGKYVRFNIYPGPKGDCKQVITVSGTPVGNAVVSLGSIVLIPIPQVLYSPKGTVFDILAASPLTTSITAAIRKAGIENLLKGPGPMTFFAPSDKAFATLSQDEIRNYIENRTGLTNLLKRLMVKGTFFTNGVQQDMELKSDQNNDIRLTLTEGVLRANDKPVVYSDITATNGVLHVVDDFV